ncbi:MAG: decaprenyl-phosphate phosphoribosyltransferase [Candidatus Magnetoovum sp. WYHC-5]|nr:decaprenyl-phosphate phosphoribosyltransferase [Candidatus Magnetoovum sp. WYHC-5]
MHKITLYVTLLRPKHWIKNLLIFAAPFFAGVVFQSRSLFHAIPSFFAFCACASTVYIINDIVDRKKDSFHPKKKSRPIACGCVSIREALVLAALLFMLTIIVAYMMGLQFLFYTLLYLVIQAGYTFYLKDRALVDIFAIASGFVIRVMAGGAAFDIVVSNWLLLTMFMVSLMLASGKRLGEVYLLTVNADVHRKSLSEYTKSTLKEILVISSSSSLIAYALYTIEESPQLIYTVPVATFGLFRYLMVSKIGFGDPTDALFSDKWLLITLILWMALVAIIRYN